MSLDVARLPEALRDHGLRVVETDGWLTRGYATLDPIGQLNHHTGGRGPCTDATAHFVIVGRGPNDPHPLKGPLCNELCGLDANGEFVVYLIAGRRARHAGPGARAVFDEYLADQYVDRTAKQRGLPDHDKVHGNRNLWGREIHHPGRGPWLDEMLDGVGRCNAAVAEVAQWSPSRSKGHKHWTSRKPDPSWPGSLPELTRRFLTTDTRDADEEDDMALIVKDPGSSKQYVIPASLAYRVHIVSPADLKALEASGLYQRVPMTAKQLAAIPDR